jgi:hypothetical protein
MKSITHNKAITQVNLPDQPFPVLVPLNESQMQYRRERGIVEAVDGFFYEDVGKMVPVRYVSETLETLSDGDKRYAFEVKYGLTVSDNALRNAFFVLMLAQACTGHDPDRDVQQALRYYRGDPPRGLFREGGPVSKRIQHEPFAVVLEELNRGLERARPVVWWSLVKKKASLGLYCPDAYSALFALALRGMGLPGGSGVCQRCGNPFLRSRSTQRYCSHRCQLTASMRRFRERHLKTRKRSKRTKTRIRKHFRR